MKSIYKKWWFQLSIWGSVFFFFFMMMSQFKEFKFAFFAACYSTLTMLSVQLVSRHKLIPLHKANVKNATLYSILTLVAFSLVLGSLEHFAIEYFQLDSKDHEHPPAIFFYIRQIFVFGFIFFVNYAIFLLEQTADLKLKQKQLREEKLETELKLLKAQINPHFIFNALNNIYSLTYMQSEKAPDSVLKLSEMLRYVFYDCNKDLVAIGSEIKYIENFTAFQQMKSDFDQKIKINVQLNNSLLEVAPMLLIPLIENAFKYSRIEEDQEAFVDIDIRQEEKTLIFNIKNSVPEQNKPLKGSGLGINNVKHRLEIIYPQSHKIEVKDYGTVFNVKMELSL